MKTIMALPIDTVLTTKMLQLNSNLDKNAVKKGIEVVYLRVNEIIEELIAGNINYGFFTTLDGMEYSNESEEYFKVRELDVRYDDRRLMILGKETTQISEGVSIVTPFPNFVRKILLKNNLDNIRVMNLEEDMDEWNPDYYELPKDRMLYKNDLKTRFIDFEKSENNILKERTFFPINKIGIFSSIPAIVSISN